MFLGLSLRATHGNSTPIPLGSADNLPIAFTDYGCAQLAACLESEPEFDDHTVWYKKCIDSPADCPPLTPTQTAQWWTAYRHVMERAYATSEGD
jgi:hypothetical protein